MRLGEQIAVLDGLGTIDPSAGNANAYGGSNYPDGNALPLLQSTVGLNGFTSNKLLELPTLVFQQMLNALGAKIPEDGKYGKTTSDGLIRVVVQSGGDEPADAAKGAKSLVPFANGKAILIPTRVVDGLVKLMQKMSGATVLAGFAGAVAPKQKVFNTIPNTYSMQNAINASGGANWSGGSAYPEENAIPLMTSTIGLAAADSDLMGLSAAMDAKRTSAAQRSNMPDMPMGYSVHGVINASNGANYSGGSTYPEDNAIPLMTSTIGLAGFGVINASGGANYSGGSNWEPGLPLLTSTVGLVGLAQAADKFTKRRGTFRRTVTTGDLLTDARRKIADVFASLRGVVANPRETADNKKRAMLLMSALKTKIQAKAA